MTKSKQFWVLLKFQLMARPVIWFIIILTAVPLFMVGIFSDPAHPSLEIVLHNPIIFQSLFMVGIFGVWSLASEMAPSDASITSIGSEFLLTRAIDRSVLYRSRAALFYLFIFLAPLAVLVYSLKSPDLWVTESSTLVQQECLTSLPGSTLVPNLGGSHSPLISIPRGALFVAAWYCWRYAVAGLGIQTLLSLLYPLKRRTPIFFTTLVTLCIVPLAFELTHKDTGLLAGTERLFFSFAGHQWEFWILTALAIGLGQLWSERRFCQLDQSH
ncbi:MAG TPA: hypothetical protein VG838_08455 [Opitutaceae bacterium]|nr:hypothetical protein [Opitutaceae bacterium]